VKVAKEAAAASSRLPNADNNLNSMTTTNIPTAMMRVTHRNSKDLQHHPHGRCQADASDYEHG
jgi:hypothetical protein